MNGPVVASRDALALLIHQPCGCDGTCPPDTEDYAGADAIIAAGYRKAPPLHEEIADISDDPATRRALAKGWIAGGAGEALRALAAHVVTACREGGVEALRQAADEIELPSLDEGYEFRSWAAYNAEAAAKVWLRQRADAIEAHVAKTGESDG